MGLRRQLTTIVVLIASYQIINSKKYGAESAGEKVRNRLQGADVGPQDEMLEDPSIYRDWAMVQKGYQSLRRMNYDDNFDAESFSSEWHYFSECETKGCDGDIEYRDVYACPSCRQDDVEILLGDTCPDCGEIAEDVSKYAIFYCSDCEEDYTDMYNSESFSAHVYRGKPMSELGYAGRAMATQKMIKAADIEQSILQLEAAIKVGLISEDEIMDQLRKRFSE